MKLFIGKKFLSKRSYLKFCRQLIRNFHFVIIGSFWLAIVTAGSISFMNLVDPGQESNLLSSQSLPTNSVQAELKQRAPEHKNHWLIYGLIFIAIVAFSRRSFPISGRNKFAFQMFDYLSKFKLTKKL
jgi:hypothetical protein